MVVGEVYSKEMTAGEKVSVPLTVYQAGKYVVECGGTVDVMVGVYQGEEEVGANGMVRVCGVGKRAVRTLNGLPHLVTVLAKTSGEVTVKVRPWVFWDYLTLWFYKSTC